MLDRCWSFIRKQQEQQEHRHFLRAFITRSTSCDARARRPSHQSPQRAPRLPDYYHISHWLIVIFNVAGQPSQPPSIVRLFLTLSGRLLSISTTRSNSSQMMMGKELGTSLIPSTLPTLILFLTISSFPSTLAASVRFQRLGSRR